MQWKIQSAHQPNTFQEVESLLLQNRGITDSNSFFNPKHPNDISLSEVGMSKKAMTTAAKILEELRSSQQKVVIFGDYDADGVCATAIMWLGLKQFGITAVPFIPRRDKHGYGLSVGAVSEIIAEHAPQLIITVDNGIVAHEAVAFAQSKNCRVIVTDHHQTDEKQNSAEAVLHTTDLCGATVAYMVVAALLKGQDCSPLLDLAALATIADQVPMLGANRSFAFHGLAVLRQSPRKGIKALLEVAGIVQYTITSEDIGFGIAPRINAMGRLAHGLDALRLLCSSNTERVAYLATTLSQTNTQRQLLTKELFEGALEVAEKQQSEHVIITASTEYHEGVIGLLAGRLAQQFSKPAIVISISETTAKASVRSIPGVDIVAFLRSSRDLMTSLGGHTMAAGFGAEVSKLPQLQAALFAYAKKAISKEQLQPVRMAECKLPHSVVSLELLNTIDKFSPFGPGNTAPIFLLSELTVLQVKAVGKQADHLQCTVSLPGTVQPLKLIGWGLGLRANEFNAGDIIECIGQLQKNSWRDRVSLQCVMSDIRHF